MSNQQIPTPGNRIQLTHTDDEYTMLSSGDTGTVTEIREGLPNHPGGESLTQICVDWDEGGSLMLLAEVDEYSILNS